MAKTQKAETPKVVALGVVIAIIAILLVVQISSFVNPPDTGPATTTPEGSTPPATATTPGVTANGEIVVPDSPVSTETDPFRRVLQKREQPLATVPEPDPTASGSGSGSGAKPDPLAGTIQLPKVGGEGTETRPIEVKPPVDEPTKPRLSGALLGKRPVAVIEIGDKTFVVGVGEKLPGGYRVLAIRETSVVLSSGKKRITITLDDPRPADAPAAPGGEMTGVKG